MNLPATALTLIAATAPGLAIAGERPSGAGVRGQLEGLAGRTGESESAPLRIRFSAPSWEEMEYARGLGALLGKPRARAERVSYRSHSDSSGKVLRGQGVRVDLGSRARAERVRFADSAAARRFALLHAPLGGGPCFVEVRGRQVGVLRGASLASERRLQLARQALWSGLPAPQVPRPALVFARPKRETLIVHGSLDRVSRGVLRQVVDRSETSVVSVGGEEPRAPAGEMRLTAPGRVSAWVDTRADRHEQTAALSQTLARIPRAPLSAIRRGSLARSSRGEARLGSLGANSGRQGASRSDRGPISAGSSAGNSAGNSAGVLSLRAKVGLALRSQPGGAWNGDLRPGERAFVVGRERGWLEVADRSGRALGWVLFDKHTLELKTLPAR